MSFLESLPEINSAKESIMSCFELLIPTPEQFFISEENHDDGNNLTLRSESLKNPINIAGNYFLSDIFVIDFGRGF